jgi:hypothetical protein
MHTFLFTRPIQVTKTIKLKKCENFNPKFFFRAIPRVITKKLCTFQYEKLALVSNLVKLKKVLTNLLLSFFSEVTLLSIP